MSDDVQKILITLTAGAVHAEAASKRVCDDPSVYAALCTLAGALDNCGATLTGISVVTHTTTVAPDATFSVEWGKE